ncbi:MAG TPA: LptA/OstA family protein [Caulobacteraceae bacterium]|nr:LptA/OstA family protein [Caulobacteraceae bacterium]
MTPSTAARGASVALTLLLATGFVAGGRALADARSSTPLDRSNGPIDITANEAEVVQSKCMAIWRGAAEALQGTSRLRADTITVFSHPKAADASGQGACGGTDRIVADGHVYYVTPQQTAHGDHAVYSQPDDQIVLTGNVIVVQGDNVARGDRLTIKVSTKEARMDSDITGPGKSGRVRGVFYPDKSGQAAGPAKP